MRRKARLVGGASGFRGVVVVVVDGGSVVMLTELEEKFVSRRMREKVN